MKKGELRRIMDREGLQDWELKKSLSGWITFPISRKIILKNYTHFSLFLHEVAHAKTAHKIKTDRKGNGEFHNYLWADEYTDLVNKYTMPNEKLIKLFKNKLVSWNP